MNSADMIRRAIIGKKAPYTELDFIQSNGTQAINTGIYSQNGLTIETFFTIAQRVSNVNNTVYGGRQSAGVKCIDLIDILDNIQNLRSDYGNTLVYPLITPVVGTKYKALKVNNLTYIDDVLKATHTAEVWTTTIPIYLFAVNNNGAISNNLGSTQIHSHKVWDISNNLIQDLIPVLKDGVPCMYDKVTSTYKYNIGTGTFIYG